jgi:hypothetical protein
MFVVDLKEIFSKRKVDEKVYRKKLQAYKEAFHNFWHESPP